MKKQLMTGFIIAVSMLHLKTGICQIGYSQDTKAYAAELPKENYFNTVTGKIGSRQYKFILIGDKIPFLTIDQEEVSRNKLPQYQELLDSLSHVIWERQKKEAERAKQYITKKKPEILTDLVEQKVCEKKEDIKSFYLTSFQLTVNGISVSPKVFEFFKKKYILSADGAFYYEQ
jgi:hypothetical protein